MIAVGVKQPPSALRGENLWKPFNNYPINKENIYHTQYCSNIPIDWSKNSIGLCSGLGTGKTKVITDRVKKLIHTGESMIFFSGRIMFSVNIKGRINLSLLDETEKLEYDIKEEYRLFIKYLKDKGIDLHELHYPDKYKIHTYNFRQSDIVHYLNMCGPSSHKKSLFIETFDHQTIYDIVHNRKTLRQYFQTYLDFYGDKKVISNLLIMQAESSHKLFDKDEFGKIIFPYKALFDHVFMDEPEAVLTQFSSSATMTNKGISLLYNNWEGMKYIIINCKSCFSCDAFYSAKTFDFFKSCGKEPIVYKNTYSAIAAAGRKAYKYEKSWYLVHKMFDLLKQGKKIVFPTNSKTFALQLEQRITAFNTQQSVRGLQIVKYKIYTENTSNKERDELANNVNEIWISYDLIIYTPVITVGINFDVPEYFDVVFLYGCSSSCSVRT